MSEYRRFISYIYAYENGQKTSNAGFAKIEIRDSFASIELHIRGMNLSAPSAEFYLYTVDNNDVIGIKLGDVPFKNGCTDWKFTLPQTKLENSEYTINDVNGILLNLDKTIIYISQWNEKEINLSNFHPIIHNNNDDFNHDNVQKQEEIVTIEPEHKNLQSAELAEPLPTQKPFKKEDSPTDSTNLTDPTAHPSVFDSFFNEQDNAHNIIYPFSDETVSCVQIDLKDLQLLPNSKQQLLNNSFLIRSFFTYHHLVIGKTKNSKHNTYFIGAPGIRYQQEHVMATIFGFMDFLPDKKQTNSQTPFGYWIFNIPDESD